MSRVRDASEQLAHRWTKTSLRTRIGLLVGSVLVLAVVMRGCVNRGGRLSGGAQTVEELVEIYERAHQRKSIRQLRKILWWEAARPWWAGHPQNLDQLMREGFNVPLAEVRYLSGPPPDPTVGGEAIYYIPGARRKSSGMIGRVYGKLLLVKNVPEGQEPRIIDPAYIVMQPKGGGPYYIDILAMVTHDALLSYQDNTPPKYAAAPLAKKRRSYDDLH